MPRAKSALLYQFFRVWPDGSTQHVCDGPPLPWMGRDYKVVEALNEASALELALSWGWL